MNAAIKESRNPAWPLIFLAHAAAGLFFAYETAGALGPDLEKEMGVSDNQIGLLYSAYSIPAFVSIFINGYLNKKLGATRCVVLLSFVIAIGVSIIAAAPNFYVMFIGQLIYGTGASPMFLTATIITGRWFGTDSIGKRKLSLAVGIQFAWMRFHSFAAFVTLPVIAEKVDFRMSLCTAAFVCWGCFASGVIFYFLDRSKKYSENVFDAVELEDVADELPEGMTLSRSSNSISSNEDDELPYINSPALDVKMEEREKEREEDAKVEEFDGPTLSATLVATTEPFPTGDMEKSLVEVEKGEEREGKRKEEEGKWTKDGKRNKKYYQFILSGIDTLKGFSATYWLVLGLMLIFTCDLYTTTAFLTKYLVDIGVAKTETRAADITSLVCLANVLTSPIAGWLSGYTGWRVKYLILGSLNLVLIHGLFAFAEPPPAIYLASALGLTQSIMDTNLWPALIFTVPKKDYPFASSLVTLSYNFGLIIFPTFCGFLKDATGSWLSVNLAFMLVSASAVLLSFVLKFIDMKNGNVLDLPFVKKAMKA